jgi:tetratricopeptide (TPR) repeat protein
MMRCAVGAIVLALLFLITLCLPATGQTPAQRRTAQQLYVQAQILERRQQLPQAVAKINEALKLVPKNDVYLAYAATLELRTGQAQQALDHVRQAVRIDGGKPAYRVLLLKAARECQDADETEKAARKVIALGAGRVGQANLRDAQAALPESLYQQALTLDRAGNYDKAVEPVKEALRHDAKNAWYRTYKGELETLAERDAFARHALETPAEQEKTVAGLARYLVKPARNDRDKARLIFRWITNRVEYDVAALLGGKLSNSRPADVLARRLCVCEGYAQLYLALAREVGLEVELVRGRCKSRITGPDRKSLSHTWVAVKIEGKWQLVDPTQGAGDIDLARRCFVRQYKDYFFLPPPEKLIFTHLPRQPRWQLLSETVSDEEFDRWGLIDARLFAFGVKVEDLRALTTDKTFKEAVELLGYTGPRLKILKAPLRKQLQAGNRYDVEIEAPGVLEMGVAINGKLHLFARRGPKFVGTIVTPQQGTVFLAARWSRNGKGLEGFLRYAVE